MAELTTLEFMETARRLLAGRTTDELDRAVVGDFLDDLEREVTRLRGYPRNRFRLVVRVEAETWDLAVNELGWVAEHVAEHGPECKSVTGGGNRSHIVDVSELPEVTPERHAADLIAWRKVRKP